MIDEIDKVPIYCGVCGEPPKDKDGHQKLVKPTPKGNPRPPRGWRVISDTTMCKKCFAEKYQTIAVTVPVIGVSEVWDQLSPLWSETTALANWAVDQLIAADAKRSPEMKKLPTRPQVYLYGLARNHYHRWGNLPSSAALSILTRVESDWKSERYKVLWTNERSRNVYRYPQPFTTGDFRIVLARHEGEDRLALQAWIMGERRTFVLSRAKGFRYQRNTLNNVLNGELGPEACTELTFYRKRVNEGDHRPAKKVPGNGGAEMVRYRIMAKICVLIERRNSRNASGCLHVNTHPNSLIEALDTKGERVWWLHADHARRIVTKHEKHLNRLQRLADDRKHEKRKPKRDGIGFREMLGQVSRKDSRRIQQIADEVAASVVGFASRRRYAEIVYDDTCRDFAHNFRWAMLKQKIESKCRQSGITFRERSNDKQKSKTNRKKRKRDKSND